MYDEPSSTQPNYMFSSLDPTYAEPENDETPNGYDYIKHPRGIINMPQFKAANPTPVRTEASENDFFDAEQHTYEVVNANKEEKVKNNTPNSDIDGNEPTLNTYDTLDNPTPVSDEASKKKKEDDFFNAEKHTYSVVNAKCKKRANEKLSDDEREREEDY